jgi:hypothetical protein
MIMEGIKFVVDSLDQTTTLSNYMPAFDFIHILLKFT